MDHVPNLHKRGLLTLLAFRWASLLPGLWLIFWGNMPENTILVLVFFIAVSNTLVITLFQEKLNHHLVRHPVLLGVDLVFAAGLFAASGGTQSPYYLFALSPLLAGAFFFQLPGAFAAAGAFTPLYFLALWAAQNLFQIGPELEAVVMQVSGIWLVTVLFSFPSILLNRLRSAHDELAKTSEHLADQNTGLAAAHQQLKIVHDLTLLLQAAPDILSVQERVLSVVTGELGYPRAVLGLVDPGFGIVGGWRAMPLDEAKPKIASLQLASGTDPLLQGLFDEQTRWHTPGQRLSSEPALDRWLGPESWLIIPLKLREHPVGILLVHSKQGSAALTGERLNVLSMVAGQAAVALGTTILCIDRARRLAVEQERNRIARDIHDSVSQSLFGIIYSLDACVEMLPEQAEAVKTELGELHDLASAVRDQVRRSIYDLWPSELTLERFETDLQNYVTQCCKPRTFHIKFSIKGNFDGLSPALRRSLFRVVQEALNNAARHAQVDCAEVEVNVTPQDVFLRVRDGGVGFDPSRILAQAVNSEHFGLSGIQERIRALGGECAIHSVPGQGTQIEIHIPFQRLNHA